MPRSLAITLLFLFLPPTANAADEDIRPGLWEITTSSDLLWFVPQIPPEQMQNLKNLAEQYGVELPQVRMGDATSKACITQQMVEQKELPIFYQSELGCTSRNAARTGTHYQMEFVCDGPLVKGHGTAQGSVTSAESFSARTHFDGVAQGRPVNEQADIRGRWLGADCGSVKPL